MLSGPEGTEGDRYNEGRVSGRKYLVIYHSSHYFFTHVTAAKGFGVSDPNTTFGSTVTTKQTSGDLEFTYLRHQHCITAA